MSGPRAAAAHLRGAAALPGACLPGTESSVARVGSVNRLIDQSAHLAGDLSSARPPTCPLPSASERGGPAGRAGAELRSGRQSSWPPHDLVIVTRHLGPLSSRRS